MPIWKTVLVVLRFYGWVNPMGSCWARSVYLTTLLLGRVSPLSGYPVLCTIFCQKLTSALLESGEVREMTRENIPWTNLHEKKVTDQTGVEPTTCWSPVRCASNWATEAAFLLCPVWPEYSSPRHSHEKLLNTECMNNTFRNRTWCFAAVQVR